MVGTLRAHIRGNIVAYVALFVALGGTSYAAVKLPAGSVGTKQLRSNAVTSEKVKDNSLRATDFASGTLVRGPRGPEGPAGPAGSLTTTVPSNTTLRGRFEAGNGNAGNTSTSASDSISFGVQLPAAPTVKIVMDPPGTAQCPGSVADPQAAAGYLCIYVGDRANVAKLGTILDNGALDVSTRFGTGVFVLSAAAGTVGARGSWAVTSP